MVLDVRQTSCFAIFAVLRDFAFQTPHPYHRATRGRPAAEKVNSVPR
jgi:hypothetical protein